MKVVNSNYTESVKDHWSFIVQYNTQESISDITFIRRSVGVDYVMSQQGVFVSSQEYRPADVTTGSFVTITNPGKCQDETIGYTRSAFGPGSLSYIDGGTSTQAITPLRKGEPVVNYVHFPAHMSQTMHTHPSQRIGFVLEGSGCIETPGTNYFVMKGDCFIMERLIQHRFVTAEDSIALYVWAPDSEAGPTDESNALLNRTYVK